MSDGSGTGWRLRQQKNGWGQYDFHDAEAFDLQPLQSLRFTLEPNTVADLTVAENSIWDLNQRPVIRDKDVYAQAMLNIEAMASVRMDGKPPSADAIFRELAEASLGRGEESDHLVRFRRDRASLEYALEVADDPLSVQSMRDIHAKVLPPKHAHRGGRLRDDLRQVGGSRYHVFGAAYTMPPPQQVEPLLDDLVAFMAVDTMPVVEQAAIAHAQLVNIHPFERGNGKMARMMVHAVLRYRGITPHLLLPITPIIVTSTHDYVAGIDKCKFDGSEPGGDVAASMNQWLSYFAVCCLNAAGASAGFINDCESTLREQAGALKLRRGSVAERALHVLPAMPVFTAQMLAERTGASFKRASEACKQLEVEGVVAQDGSAKRNRIFYSPETLDAYLAIDALR